MGEEGSVHASAWPEAEEEYLVDKEVVVAAAINGKVRAEIRVGADDVENRNKVIDLAKTNEKIQKWLSGSRIVKEIYVPGKMINFVVVTEG